MDADLAVSPIWPRQSMRIMSHTGSVALRTDTISWMHRIGWASL